MKKGRIIFLSAIMAFSLCACSANEAAASEVPSEEPTKEPKPEEKKTDHLEEGIGYLYGVGKDGYDMQKAEQAFKKAAKVGEADAWFYLGEIYSYSCKKEDWDKAKESYQRALDEESPLGYAGMIRYLLNCPSEDRDQKRLEKLVAEAKEAKTKEAAYAVGLYFDTDYIEDKDPIEALQYYTLATESDRFIIRNRSYNGIGNLYLWGIGKDAPDYEKAREWFEKALAEGYSLAYCNIGYMYDMGIGADRDVSKALEYYKKAIEAGARSAHRLTAHILSDQKKYDESFKEFVKGFELGDMTCVQGIYDLYTTGECKDLDEEKMLSYLETGAEFEESRALIALGKYYEESDPQKALSYYEKINDYSQKGFVTYRIGFIHYKNEDEEDHYHKAYDYFIKAVDEKCPWAAEMLAYMYVDGDYVEKNDDKAIEYIKMEVDLAADSGYSEEYAYESVDSFAEWMLEHNRITSEQYDDLMTYMDKLDIETGTTEEDTATAQPTDRGEGHDYNETNFNSDAVYNGVEYWGSFMPAVDVYLDTVTTYHWNNGKGVTPGTIGLLEDGVEIGTWTAEGSTNNTYWTIHPNIMCTKGHTYRIVDSDPDTWSSNEKSEWIGFFEIHGTGYGGEQ